jgi:hypothetical protein
MIGLALSVLWYGAAVIVAVAVLLLLWPMRSRKLMTRGRMLALIAIGLTAIALLAMVPPMVTAVQAKACRLDDITPVYHYSERHVRHVNAPPDRVYAAARAVTADDIQLFQTFTRIRRLGRAAPESVLNAPAGEPLLSVALRSGFILLADEPGREIVFGAVVLAPESARGRGPLTAAGYRALDAPGFVKATMNFYIEPEQGGSRVTTETRVAGTDTNAIRAFTPYWRTILPGSWILRVTWLAAIARRAESGTI